jgi:hypothetical protein
MFLDDETKWVMQGRFAGKDLNCGHFFSLNKLGADAETQFYKVDKTNASFLSVQVDLADVLDLTSEDGIVRAFTAVVEEGSRFNASFIAQELIEIVPGGSILTDRVGHWASNQGYEGILFIGARAVHGANTTVADPRGSWNHNLFLMQVGFYLNDRTELNLVVFRGRYLASRVEQYRLDDGPWVPNPLFRMDEGDIEAQLSRDPDFVAVNEEYQERKRSYIWTGGIRYEDGPPRS